MFARGRHGVVRGSGRATCWRVPEAVRLGRRNTRRLSRRTIHDVHRGCRCHCTVNRSCCPRLTLAWHAGVRRRRRRSTWARCGSRWTGCSARSRWRWPTKSSRPLAVPTAASRRRAAQPAASAPPAETSLTACAISTTKRTISRRSTTTLPASGLSSSLSEPAQTSKRHASALAAV